MTRPRVDLHPTTEEGIRASAVAYAKILVDRIGGNCWSIRDDLFSAAYEGYVEAVRRFKPPGDVNRYIRAWMRGRIHEALRQEARAHGLVRPHRRRCRRCGGSLGHDYQVPSGVRLCRGCDPTPLDEEALAARRAEVNRRRRERYRLHAERYRLQKRRWRAARSQFGNDRSQLDPRAAAWARR